MKKYNFLAFDIGATSGRAVLGTLVGDKFEMQELHRFPNAIMELHGKYYWDMRSGSHPVWCGCTAPPVQEPVSVPVPLPPH